MFLTTPTQIRLQKDDLKEIERIVKFHKGEKYSSESHFIRCAIIRLIREEKQDIKELSSTNSFPKSKDKRED